MTTSEPIIACTAICQLCSDGSCQPRDKNCKWLSCPTADNSYLIWGIVGIILLLIIVFIVAFMCYRKKNKSLRQNFEQLTKDETANNRNGNIGTNDEGRNEIEKKDMSDAALIQTDQVNGMLVR